MNFPNIDTSAYQEIVSKMTTDKIRRELENLQGLILDSDDRIDWAILNGELLARGELSVKWRHVRMSGSRR